MTAAKTADTPDTRWRHLERAHIISQPDPWLHTHNHVAMLALALRQHDRREAVGQIVRIIVAAPGSLSGRYPEGNTGRLAAGLISSSVGRSWCVVVIARDPIRIGTFLAQRGFPVSADNHF